MKKPDKMEIPEKGVEFVNEWAKKIKPLVLNHDTDKVCHFTNRSDHFNESYPWNAKPRKEATDVEEICVIPTLHTWGYYGFFKPSVAEVLQQIPEDLLEEVDYFYVQGPNDVNDLNAQIEYVNAGFHLAQTTLYKKKKGGKKGKK